MPAHPSTSISSRFSFRSIASCSTFALSVAAGLLAADAFTARQNLTNPRGLVPRNQECMGRQALPPERGVSPGAWSWAKKCPKVGVSGFPALLAMCPPPPRGVGSGCLVCLPRQAPPPPTLT